MCRNNGHVHGLSGLPNSSTHKGAYGREDAGYRPRRVPLMPPFTDKGKQRAAERESKRRARERDKAEAREALAAKLANAPPWPDDPAQAVAEWAEGRLVVPAGHANAGEPMRLPEHAVPFLRDALADGIREALLSTARKNAKSATIAVLVLAYLADDGPLRSAGWRAGVASLSREKSAELWTQARDIAEASDLEGVTFGKVPRHLASDWGRCEFLSADRHQGQASGFDLAITDELGLFPAKGGRELVNGLLGALSARNGRMIAISVLGDFEVAGELITRRHDPSVVVHLHQAPADARLDDETAWHAANPALGSIKSLDYMRDMARRAQASPSEQRAFAIFELNLPGRPEVDMIVALDRYRTCANSVKPERAGSCYVGFDLGGSASMTAAAAYWPDTGRLDCWGGFGDNPDLMARGEADGVGDRYIRMADRGELVTFPGRVTPVAEFLERIAAELASENVVLASADRYRQAEAQDELGKSGAQWPMEWRAVGSGAHGSADVRAFQKSVEGGTLRPGDSLILESAIAESSIRYDGNGNPALDKARAKGRIDCLSAAILAVGIGSRSGAVAESFFFRPDDQPTNYAVI